MKISLVETATIVALVSFGIASEVSAQTFWQFPAVGIFDRCVTITSRSGPAASRGEALALLENNVSSAVRSGEISLRDRFPGIGRTRYRSGGSYCGISPVGHACFEAGSLCGGQRGGSLPSPCPPDLIRDRDTGRCETPLRDTRPGALAPQIR